MIKRMFRRGGLICVFLLSTAATSGAAEVSYALKIRGLTVGVVTLDGNVTGARYSVEAFIKSTGLASAFRNFSYKGAAQGTVAGGQLAPEHYQEVADTGRRRSTVVMTYKKGRTKVD